MAFEARQRNIRELLSKTVFKIPRNQRKYVWEESNWADLWNDLLFVIDRNEPDKNHFIGSIVLTDESQENGIGHFSIIDGQQRITTIILFLTMLIKQFRERKMENEFKGCIDYVISKDFDNNPHCVLNTDYHTSIEKIVKDCTKEDNHDSIEQILDTCVTNKRREKLVRNCCMYYHSKMQELSQEKLKSLRNALLNINYVSIVAPTEEDSYTIFEILNARGRGLADHEMVKNYIMRYIYPKDQVDRVKAQWEEEIENRLNSSVERFFNHYAIHKYLNLEEKSVFKTIRKHVKENIEDFFNDVLTKAMYYNIIEHPVKEGDEANCGVNEYKIFSYFKKKNVYVFRPVILSLMQCVKTNKINHELYNKTLEFIYYFYICYNVIGLGNSNKIDGVIRKHAYNIGKQLSPQSVNDFRNDLILCMPTDEAFKNNFMDIGWSNHWKYYDTTKKKSQVQTVLEIFEQCKSGKDIGEYTIEHINPDSKDIENAKIGNLIALENNINQNCKDKAAEDKFQMYKNSNIVSTRDFATKIVNGEFNFNSDERAKRLCEIVLNEIKLHMGI